MQLAVEEASILSECGNQVPTTWGAIFNSVPMQRNLHSIDLDVTEACNLSCIYCFKWQKKAIHMDEQTAKWAIDWLVEASGKERELKVNLMGGEPLLRFDLLKTIVPYGKLRARQRGKSLHFGCTTNCTLVTDEIISFWRRFGMGFHCSIDGIPEVQDVNRPFLGGGRSSAAVERTVPKILSYRPEVMARATISPQSVQVLFESAKYLARLGFQSITFKLAVNCTWRERDFDELRMQYQKVGDYYIQRLLSGEQLDVEEFGKGIRMLHSSHPQSRFPCGAARGVMLIDPRGDIWPCHRFGPHQCAGQFRLGRLGDHFNNRLRNVFLRYNVFEDARPKCGDCRAAVTCRSWCYAECVESTRTFYDPGVNYCRANQVLHDEVMRIHDRLRCKHSDALQRVLEAGLAKHGQRRKCCAVDNSASVPQETANAEDVL